ncbi:MAG: polyprenyl synthetase family protein, partial [Microcystaceae cyanobacterium]
HKTGALLETSLVTGALLAGAPEEAIQRLTTYAQNIGLAFQIIDDILDITATQEELGKSIGKDVQAQKATYPSLWGIDESRRQAQQLIDEAIAVLETYGEAANPLRAIAQYIINRKN